MQALRIHLQVLFALILREARVRHGRNRLGYLWSIIQPAALISILTIVFSFFGRGGGAIPHFGTFFAVGVLTFNVFRNTASYVANAHDMNRALFNYPMVKPLDTTFARFILEVATSLFVGILVLSVQIAFMDAPGPNDIPTVLLPFFLMAWMALGAALTLTAIKRFAPAIMQLYAILMGPMFIISGIFFSINSFPPALRELLLWNPFVHGIEAARIGYYAGYRDAGVSLMYLFTWGTVLNFIGFIGERLTRFKM